MIFDTTHQADYLLRFLDGRRDEIHDSIYELENIWTDHVALHANPFYQALKAELDLNATLTVRVMNDRIQLKREETINAN